MSNKKKILCISGSTRNNSSNLKLLQLIAEMTHEKYEVSIFNELSTLPHFNPDLDNENPPQPIIDFRNKIEWADAVIICTPEYVFSIPGSLKNALEWMVSTTIFSDKPVGLITASAQGEKGQAELKLVMQTIGAIFHESTTLLIQGIRGKINDNGKVTDEKTMAAIEQFLFAFEEQLN
ncbi:MAG: NADPH-dependent FMN reductase [Ferruginibacter sp.]